MKRFLSLILSLILVFTIIPMAVVNVSASTYGDWEYARLSATTCEVTEYNGTGIDITIPNSFNGLTVTSIGYRCFYNWSDESNRIASVIIPDTVTVIGERAFENCDNLTYVKLSNSLVKIGNRAFINADLRSVTIPKSCITIEENAFYGNCYLSKVVIYPNTISIEGSETFTKNFWDWDVPTIYGYSGSYAQKYAKYIGAKFKNINKPAKPSKPNIKVSSSKKKTATLKWASISGSKYKIAYSTSKKKLSKLKNGRIKAKGVTVIASSSAKKTIKKLKSKKKYYFKVCAYRTYYNTNDNIFYVYGDWSKIKSKKIK